MIRLSANWFRATSVVFFSAFVLVCGLLGCSKPTTGQPNGIASAQFDGKYPFLVVCTTGMVADAVLHVGGDHVEVLEADGEKISKGGSHIRIVQLMGGRTTPATIICSPPPALDVEI